MKKIRLFLSSPGDVEAERGKVQAVVEQINLMLGNVYDVRLEVIDWKTHVAPDMGRPQGVINRQIGEYDIFLGIMWKRFGTPTGAAESGTEEEFRTAYRNWERDKRPRILFYFSKASYYPKDLHENEQWGKVLAFKDEFPKKGLVWEYPSADVFPDILRGHLARVLHEWFSKDAESPLEPDFSRYIKYLKSETMYMDIRGLVTGEPKAHQFRIDELYIPLMSKGEVIFDEKGGKRAKDRLEGMIPREVPLQKALQKKALIIRGDPGAGKTTFLKLIVFTICQRLLGDAPSLDKTGIFWREDPPLPIFIRPGRLVSHINKWKGQDPAHTPSEEESPEWLLHFLKKQGNERNWQISARAFRRKLTEGRCLILLDGLDEAPDRRTREMINSFASNVCNAYPNCQVVLTSRPAALAGLTMPQGFSIAEIAPLDEQGIETFLSRWCQALYPEVPEKSCELKEELKNALQSTSEARRMARTPVMSLPLPLYTGMSAGCLNNAPNCMSLSSPGYCGPGIRGREGSRLISAAGSSRG